MKTNKRKAKSTVQVDNDAIKVVHWSFEPGASTGWHKHDFDYLVIPMENGQLTSIDNMNETVLNLQKGKSYFKSAGVEHEIINSNEFAFQFVEVELK
ncbi:hypothetical protein J0656_18590 [Muricauda ruestringensis]|uniref:Cupin type-2 domain-containing protein n=1 Tax=Flagellimonas aurea TaxID=2915619 RepID=A0ABS3GAV9_9FLAO|nr:cupin domain-containing protein [Allomuricauda aurea]MBO0356033.1 hypothetical protein [Allomuricauda aurea]